MLEIRDDEFKDMCAKLGITLDSGRARLYDNVGEFYGRVGQYDVYFEIPRTTHLSTDILATAAALFVTARRTFNGTVETS